jgi:hypothetical protein
VRAAVDRIEVSNVTPHASYLRLYVGVTARAGVFLPCPAAAGPPVAPATPPAPTTPAKAPAAAPTPPPPPGK